MNRRRNEENERSGPRGRSAGKRSPSSSPRRRKKDRTESRSVSVVGLVGGIGSGKSTIANKLAELGATVIDADAVGHALLNQGPVQEILVRHFGPEILGEPDEDGTRQIDRRTLGTIVFSDDSARKVLDETMHPRMRTTFERVISRVARQVYPKPGALRLPPPVIVLDAAILYEAGWDDLCNLVVFVDAPRKERLKRLKEQRNWLPEELDRREAAQWPVELKRTQADVTVKNSDGVDPVALEAEISKIWARVDPNRRIQPKAKNDYRHLIEDEIEGMVPNSQPAPRNKPRSGTRQPIRKRNND